MIKIKNINEAYGMAITFSGTTLADAVDAMQQAVRACGDEFASVEIVPGDYEMLTDLDN